MLAHSGKMDIHLKRSLVQSYRFLRKVPCFLQNWIRPLLERASRVPVIIRLKDELTAMDIGSLQKSRRLSRAKHHPLIRSVSCRVSIANLKRLCEHDKIACIHYDRKVHTLLDVATPSIGSAAAQRSGWTGKGVTVAVVDTGIYPHPDLTQPVNRIIGFQDFVKHRTTPYDDNGHGTHVAGDVAGNGFQSGGTYKGPAPEANLVGVKVLDKMGAGQLSTVISGIEWCIQNRDRYGIRVISMSLGSTAATTWKADPVCQAVEKAWSSGIIVVVAAGNEGPDSSTISSPGISPSPITVGAADTHRTIPQSDDTVADFSSRGPTIDRLVKPDIVSPGIAITSLRSPGSYLDKIERNARVGSWYFTLSGTSMATPIVAGTIAQILQKNPTLTPDQVKSLLKGYAVNLGYDVNIQGSGEVNVQFLIENAGAD
ncbi:S8 family peptidase [Effusibacillus pohliae]|uniref:S8 family peptidase n=1 Tax=Effusibacillus pohliae TaxID=232270 RepID=UPI00068744AD|nr:S8 family peptidase [Effusibacillus pohliae]